MIDCEECGSHLLAPSTTGTAQQSTVLESFVLVKPSSSSSNNNKGYIAGIGAATGSGAYSSVAPSAAATPATTTTISASNLTTSNLLSILSPPSSSSASSKGYSNSSAPALCKDCTSQLLTLSNNQLDAIKKERDRLIHFEREVGKRRANQEMQLLAEESGSHGGGVTMSSNGGKEALKKEIAKLKKAEQQSIQDLYAIESEREALNAEKALLDAEEAALAVDEAMFWKSHAEYSLKAAEVRDAVQALQTRYAHDSNRLEKLQKTNVYNDVFCIGQEGGLGTINGLRLGRLPNTLVDWPEINAAWGHTLLLLSTIARKYSFVFETYRLIPMASFSRVEKIGGDKAVYELYGSGDFQLNRLLLNRRFDQAMVAFLDCLRQLMEFVKTRDRSVVLPHSVYKDRIGEVSIKLQFGSDEIWSRALRHVLLNLKILLAKVST